MYTVSISCRVPERDTGTRLLLLKGINFVQRSTPFSKLAQSNVPDREVLTGDRRLALRRTRRALGTALLLLFFANAAVITYLWWQGSGLQTVHDLGGLTTSIGRITGLLGAYLLLVLVVFLMRIPLLERVAGFDRYTAWHRL